MKLYRSNSETRDADSREAFANRGKVEQPQTVLSADLIGRRVPRLLQNSDEDNTYSTGDRYEGIDFIGKWGNLFAFLVCQLAVNRPTRSTLSR